MICKRMKEVLPGIVNLNQSAFVAVRSIMHNIMLSEDLVRLYNRKKITPRYMIKIDLKKVYNTVNWKFLEHLLKATEFLVAFVARIMTCLCSEKFSISLNVNALGSSQVKEA